MRALLTWTGGAVAADTATKMAWTISWDTGGWWDAGNERYTPQQPGLFDVTAMLAIDWTGNSDGDYFEVQIRLNDVVVRSSRVGASNAGEQQGPLTASLSALVEVNGSTDYLEVFWLSSKQETPADSAVRNTFEAVWAGDPLP